MKRIVTIPAGYVHRHRVTLAWVAVVASTFLALCTLAFGIYQNRQLAKQGDEAHAALCAFTVDLKRRAQESRDFLEDPPRTIIGIPVTAEVVAKVQSDLANREATLRSLAALDCG